MEEEISIESTKEEVAEYFLKAFKIPEKAKNNLIKEDISGEVLPDLTDGDFLYLGIKLGPKVKIKKFLKENEEKFKPKEITEKIKSKSNKESIKNFFEKCLNFKGNLNVYLNRKRLIELEGNEEEMKKKGLNLGQRKKLIRFINYLKTLKDEESEDDFIYIDEESNDEEVAKFLRLKSKLSQESINSLGLDAQSLFLLDEAEIDNSAEISDKEKEGLKKSLKELKITVNEKSNKEEVAEFFKVKFGVSDDFIVNNDLDGESLFLITNEEIDEFEEISQEKKEKLKNILPKLKQKQKTQEKKEQNNEKNKEQNGIENNNRQNQKVNNTFIKQEQKQELNKEQTDKINQEKDKEFIQQINLGNEVDNEALITQKNKQYDLALKQNIEISKLKENTDSEHKYKINKEKKESQQESEININIENSEFNPKPKPEPEIRISYDSTKEQVANFLKIKLGFNPSTIEKLNLDGETLFILDEEDIKDLEVIKENKKVDLLIQLLKEINIKISERSNTDEVAKFLEKTLGFDIKSIINLNLTGEKLFSLNEEKIDETETLSKEEKNKLKKYLNLMNINITQTSDKNDVFKFLKIKLGFCYKSIKELNMDGENLFLLDEDEIDLFNKIKKDEILKLKQFLNKTKKPKEGVQKMNQKSKYNVFFPLCMKEDYQKNIIIKSYDKGYFTKTFVENDIIHEENYTSTKNEKLKFLIFHVHSNKTISDLRIMIKDKYKNLEIESKIEIRKNNEIYFLVKNLSFYRRTPDYFFRIQTKTIIKEYLSYFFNENKNNNTIDKKFKKYLLKALINEMKLLYELQLTPLLFLKFIKLCCEYELKPEKIDSLEIQKINMEEKEKINLDKKYYVTGEDIDKLGIKIEKNKLFTLLLQIYAKYDINYLLELMKSKKGDDYSRIVLDLLNDKIKYEELIFEKENDISLFQKKLLSVSTTKEEINEIIKIKKGLLNHLNFIKENFKTIFQKIEKSKTIFSYNYILNLDEPLIDDNFDEIFKIIKEIIDLTKNKKIKILNYDDIFESLVNTFSNKSLNDLCKLIKIIDIVKKEKIDQRIIENFYNLIHQKGILSVKNKFLKGKEILDFIISQDIYYFSPNYSRSRFRDPEIFKYIIITDEEKDYLKNIEQIKNNKLWNLFSDSSNKKTTFYKILIDQMKKLRDFKSIFDIFPIEAFDIEFTFLINGKINEFFYLGINEKEQNYEIIFKILDKWIMVNNKLRLQMNYIIETIEINHDLTSKYYFYLLKTPEMQYYATLFQNSILNFFLNQNRRGNNSAESLISLLLIAPNNKFLIFFLNKLEKQILTEQEFYQRNETYNFLLFKLFYAKCSYLIKNNEISNSKYLYNTVLIKNKIYNDLQTCQVPYNIVNNLLEDDIFYKKIIVIIENETESKKLYNKFKENMKICNELFDELETIKDYYTSFFSMTKENAINLIKKEITKLKKTNISEIVKGANKIFEAKPEFDFQKAKEESKNIKYKTSLFFMSIYNKNKDNIGIESEEQIYKDSLNDFIEALTKIIQQKETKEPFFEIKCVELIMKTVEDKNNNIKKEMLFLSKEFENLGKKDYILNNLLEDLINFSQKDIVKNTIQGIIEFIEAYKILSDIEITDFTNKLKQIYNSIISQGVSGEDIKKAKDLLIQYNFDINIKTSLISFFEIFIEQKKSIEFLKTIRDKNFDIRYLNEFLDESEASDLQTSDIDNLIYINDFFNKIINNKEINTDEKFLKKFKDDFEKDKEIAIKLKGYIKTYSEINQIYKLYDENPEMTIEKISKLIKDSAVNLFKDEKQNLFTFVFQYKKQGNQMTESNIKELEELRNKILMSSSNENILNKEIKDQEQNILDRAKITKEFVNLIDNIKQLNQTLNSLLKSGYCSLKNISIKVKNAKAFEEGNENKDLQKIIEEYREINKNFKNDIREGYKKFPILRLFYGQQFLTLYEKAKNKDIDISWLINSVTLNKINNPQVDYIYNDKNNQLENINFYLEKIFNKYNINLDNIYAKNKVIEELNLKPGLYRKIRVGDNNDLIENVLNIYQNMTKNVPIINTLLICNEETSMEKIRAFLYRAILCESPVLFVISNLECLELSIIQNIIRILTMLYKYKNKQMNSYLLFLYEKIDSGLVRDLERFIPERNILNNNFIKKPSKPCEIFEKIELYSSKYSGYGKTFEIKYKVKNLKGEYKYLPIGGCFTRNYVLNNLINLNLDFQKNNIYLHLDLSETDNDDLMNEILFKLVILRYMDSSEKIFYLGYDINLILEIPNCFIEFDKKYKLLNLFKKIHIEKLNPLRLEEGVEFIGDSPISIVAEVLSLYDTNQIGTKNIDLNAKIIKTEAQIKKYEEIIDKHFNVENQSYYQKMNFIKILSVQFKKFVDINNVFLNYDIAVELQKGDIIKQARHSVISNFIKLSRVFTRSPYDGVLLSQNKSMEIFGKYNGEKAIEEGILKLADDKEKKEIFSFEKIKPSLVFFNRDGGSLSIISNNDKYDKEYQDLHQLWNSQNPDINDISKMKDLIDYKNLTHEQFLEEIIKLFSLDTSDGSDKQMGIKDLEKICEDLDNYIFVADNFIKMVRILLNIEAKIPLIIMGETGVGKTKLLEMLSILYGRGKQKWHRLQIHAGTTDKDIVEFIENVLEKEKDGKNKLIWVFLDEINTCNSLGLITEIICNHTYLGKKIDERFIFLAACNPYRIMTNKMRENGLVYYNMKEKNKLNNLVYTVNPLPHSLLNFIFDFGSLKFEDEKKYIINTIISLLEKINSTYKIDISNNELNYLKNEIIDSIIICHEYLRSIFDQSSVSMREIRRFGIFFEYFIKFFKNSGYKKLKSSLNISLYLCYYLRLNEKKYRKELENKLNKFYTKSFLVIPEAFMRLLTGNMLIEKNKGIALNRALKENLFSCFTCIENNVPIIIVGKPGTGKSLSFQILFNTLKGESSENSFFRTRGKLYRYYYQGSETSTSEGILQVFQKALNAKKKSSNDKNIILVFFDEMGLAERSSNNPLKVIHYLLETNKENSVPFLGISNWRLDASKINRAINLSITDYDIKDLEETANSIAEALDTNLANNYKDFFETLARVYYEYIKQNQNSIKGNKDFHGNRDFYNLIKNAMRELKTKEEQLKRNENKILTEVGLLSLSRNFGGLENSIKTIHDIFRALYAHKYDETVSITKGFTVLDAIRKNVNDPNSRYLMLISEGNDATDITKYLLGKLNKKYIELVGSKYQNDIKSGRYNEEILNKIKYIMETDNVLILRDLDMIYPSLYDIFNQNFTIMGDKKYGRIAFEYAKISSEVNKDFHVIVIVNINQIENLKLDPPFLNRFEKHIVNFNMFLEEKDINIAKKIIKYIDLIASFNNNEKLKIDLEKLLINCKQHHIEGLIFKIKNDLLSLINNNNKDQKENWIKKEGQDYENNMIEEILKKIVPIFCQDIMAAIVFLEKNLKKYDKISKNILNIYNKNNYNNFETFFKKIESRKNIIYTFSKVTENLFDDNKKEIENKFGKFSIQSFNSEMIESIKAENELIFILKSFANSKDQKILVLHFTENDLNKINSINYLINNFQKEINNLSDKFIIFLIHKQRNPKLKKKVIPDMIPFIDDNFFQIFIDNLQGKENVDILQIMQKKNEELAKEYLENSNFIEKKIYNK